MKKSRNASLKHLNSFSVEAYADQLVVLETEADLQFFSEDFDFNPSCDLILGGGSNILFAGDIKGTVILNHIPGKRIIDRDSGSVLLEASGGENWHELVLWSLEQGLSGIENLSLIPGLAGAAPIQNIGAYGVEISDTLESVRAFDIQTSEFHDFSNQQCHFAYRDSRFKTRDAGRYLITAIRLRLSRKYEPKLAYAGIGEQLERMGISTPTAKQVSDAVVQIRKRKLPDPEKLGNAGSFFKNPLVSPSLAAQIKAEHKTIPAFKSDDSRVKLSAAWMIDQCGLKGRSVGGAAVSKQHALVLVNQHNATGKDVLELAELIQKSVQKRFGVQLQPEPRIIR